MSKCRIVVVIVGCLVGAGCSAALALNAKIDVRRERWERYDSGWINTYSQARATVSLASTGSTT